MDQIGSGDGQSVCIGCQQQTFEQRIELLPVTARGDVVEQIQQGFFHRKTS